MLSNFPFHRYTLLILTIERPTDPLTLEDAFGAMPPICDLQKAFYLGHDRILDESESRDEGLMKKSEG